MLVSDAIPTVFALALGLGLVGVVVARWFAPEDLRAELRAAAGSLAAVVAVGATAGSLYFSEVRHFVPCELCWYQRIFMYPLSVVLTLAVVRRDERVRPYVCALAGLGALVSIYHVQLQLFPGQGSSCSAGPSCTYQWVDVFGFVSIPVMALASFAIILLLLTQRPPVSKDRENE